MKNLTTLVPLSPGKRKYQKIWPWITSKLGRTMNLLEQMTENRLVSRHLLRELLYPVLDYEYLSCHLPLCSPLFENQKFSRVRTHVSLNGKQRNSTCVRGQVAPMKSSRVYQRRIPVTANGQKELLKSFEDDLLKKLRRELICARDHVSTYISRRMKIATKM